VRTRGVLSLVGECVTGLCTTYQLGATNKLCVTHLLSINQISVGGLKANEYAHPVTAASVQINF
jgi:hypothetical protein